MILLEIDLTNGSILKAYIYATGQILAQHNGPVAQDNKFFYLHDRLGSVRELINASGVVVKYYTYNPFGETLEFGETVPSMKNSFMFTGQHYDSEIAEYYLRSRQYDPQIARFTSRDPATGKFKEPLSLHKYLYCENDPINHIDLNGRTALDLVNPILTGSALYAHGIDLATYAVSSGNWKFFDLAQVTFLFMPTGMSIASLTPASWRYVAWGDAATTVIEMVGRITGMSYPESFLMDPTAFYFYAEAMFIAEMNLGVSGVDMADFRRWHGSWW